MTAIDSENLPLLEMQLEILMIDRPINDVGMTVFAYACANTNNCLILETIWTKNPDIMTLDVTGRTPLHHAVRKHIDANDYEAIETNL